MEVGISLVGPSVSLLLALGAAMTRTEVFIHQSLRHSVVAPQLMLVYNWPFYLQLSRSNILFHIRNIFH